MNNNYDWNRFREISYSGGAVYNARLYVDTVLVPPSQISSITISNPIIDTSSEIFYIGSFISQKLEVKFKNLDGLNIKSNVDVRLEIGLNVDGEIVYVPIGKFLIDDLSEDYQTTCQITCLDYAVKFKTNVNYSPAFVDDKATIDEILIWLCNYYGVELGTYPSINGNVEIGTYDATVSGKQWISYIAEIKGCNAKFNGLGQLCLIPLKRPVDVTINALKSKSFKLGEKYEISRVIYFDGVRNFTFPRNSEETENNTLIIRQNNPFIADEEVAENIYNSVKDTVIWSLITENYADISLMPYYNVKYTLGVDENNNPIEYTTLNDYTWTYQMTIASKVNVKIPTKQKEITTVVKEDPIHDIKKIQSTIDEVNGELEILAIGTQKNSQQTDDIRNDLDTQYLKIQQVEQLILNSGQGLTNVYKDSGGSNVLRNTDFSANTVLEEGQQYEYWYGNAVKTTNNNAINRVSILLQSGNLNQEQIVANGTYAVSFYYKILNPLSHPKIKINDKEYNLTVSDDFQLFETGKKDTEGNYIVDPIQISDNNIRIEFITDINNSCEIYDIMCNFGESRVVYQQNINETTTDTVNISKGITITSSKEKVKFTANTDGIRVLDTNNNEVVTDYTTKGMNTKSAVVREEAQIVKVLFQEVEDQSWLTRM